ncbi:LysR family transcriptional regulator [Paracoccus albus]|uniref:LysR family transcriptional regulator n=1 Tax=Paracoccus albus TaxID=3017784 RepID=UPI0022F08D8F|nr:LysR family transcriptional regulator [Paracoccus albus]WBU59243.1 LysR family transcriptional regulator [Paracoccus albus]
MKNDFSRLDLNLLRVFDALMRHRGVTQAAQELRLTQSSASNALQRLRAQFGDRLLERQGNAMIPTRTAEELWPFVADALGSIASGIAATRDFDPATAALRFRIGMDDYALALIGPDFCTAVASLAPNIRMDILPVRHPAEAEELRIGALDFFLGAVWNGAAEFEYQPVLSESFVGLAAPSLLRDDAEMDLQSFLARPHILMSARGRVQGNVDAALAAIGTAREVRVCLPEFDAAARATLAGHGFFSCGRRLAQRFVDTYGLRPFELPLPVPGFEVQLRWHRRNSLAASHIWMRGVLLETSSRLFPPCGNAPDEKG